MSITGCQSQSDKIPQAEQGQVKITSEIDDKNQRAQAEIEAQNKQSERVISSLKYIQDGDLKQELKDAQGAIAEYNKAIEVDPKSFRAYLKICEVKSNLLKDAQGAINDCKQALEFDPKYSLAYLQIGLIKTNLLKDYQGAIAEIDKAIEISPNLARAYYYRGQVKSKFLKDAAGAKFDYAKASQLANQQHDTALSNLIFYTAR
jgi:tetratricopeptide (TPR) repeat protein